MRSINKVILIGNLTRDPELRQTPNGQNVVTFGLATNREWVTRDGRKQNSAEFHELVAWARLADICSEHLKKGKLVYVEGYLKTRSWDATDGTKKFRTEIVVQDMIMLDKKNRENGDYIPEDDFTQEESTTETSETEESATEEIKPEETPATQSEESTSVETASPIDETVTTEQSTPEDQPTQAPSEPEKKETQAQPESKPGQLDIDSDLGL